MYKKYVYTFFQVLHKEAQKHCKRTYIDGEKQKREK